MKRHPDRSKVLITGSEGKLGHSLVQSLSSAYDVHGFDARKEQSAELAYAGYTVGDLSDEGALAVAADRATSLIHLAGIPVDTGQWNDLVRVNVEGTLNVLKAAVAAGVRRVVFASSICAYGFIFSSKRMTPDFFPISEEHPCNPDDAYGSSKWIGEQLCRAFASRYGLEVVILRLATIWFPDYVAHTKRFVERIDHPEMQVDHIWAYVDVRDVTKAITLSLTTHISDNPLVLNIGAAEACTTVPTLDLAQLYYPEVPVLLRVAEGSTFSPLFDIGKAEAVLGYKPTHTWREYASQK